MTLDATQVRTHAQAAGSASCIVWFRRWNPLWSVRDDMARAPFMAAPMGFAFFGMSPTPAGASAIPAVPSRMGLRC